MYLREIDSVTFPPLLLIFHAVASLLHGTKIFRQWKWRLMKSLSVFHCLAKHTVARPPSFLASKSCSLSVRKHQTGLGLFHLEEARRMSKDVARI